MYLPDATRGYVKSLDAVDLVGSSVRGVVVNTYHLMTSPGSEKLKNLGGIKKYMNYDGLVVSDSGGWQVFSLIHRSKRKGEISDEGVVFYEGSKPANIFTPEKSISVQMDIGSDIIVCLDDFTPPDATYEEALKTVERTLFWAEKSMKQYKSELKRRNISHKERPLLMAVIQGGYFKELRKYCAEELAKLEFDGYGYGGYVINEEGELDLDLSDYVVSLIPNDKFKFALGFGRPWDIINLYKMGWELFDCTLPTRDARHKRLYTFTNNPSTLDFENPKSNFGYLYINKQVYEDDMNPVSEYCDCVLCKSYSRSYLRHLFKCGDSIAYRLATIHNIRVYTMLIESLLN